MTARAIITAVADAAERWCDADFPPRVRATAALEEGLGFTIPVIDDALDRLFGGVTVAALTGAITDELGDVAALDGVVTRPGRPAAWARSAGHVAIVSSDATIGAALAPLVYALCARCNVSVYDRCDALVGAFAETLAEELPALRTLVTVHPWTGVDAPLADAALGAADVVVAFGGAEELRAIRAACAAEATFVPFGHHARAGYLDRAALDGDGDAGAPHVLFLEHGDDVARERFAHALADAYAAAAIEFPPGRGTFPTRSDAYRIVLVDGPAGAAAHLAQHRLPRPALAVRDGLDDTAAVALGAVLGAVRVAPFGTLHAPPIGARNAGRARIADFVRWIERG
jgi:hypothetical protein